MTFFPDPIRPSEGRDEDRLRIDPIEGDKKKQSPHWQPPPEEKKPKTYAAFLMIIQKMMTFLGVSKKKNFELLSENLLEFKRLLQVLMESDQSDSGAFCIRISKVYRLLLQETQLRPQDEKLPTLLKEIGNYPPGEEHKLAYYLSECVDENWLPIPFREILKKLFADHRVHPSYSSLTKWTESITEILQS